VNLANVMDEVGAALSTMDNLNVYPYNADSVVPPAVVIGWPDQIEYDQTYGRGSDKITLPMWVVVGRQDQRTSRDRLAVYLDGAGDKSIKALVDGGTYTACDTVRVATASPVALTLGGVDYLAAAFDIEIMGEGTA
jgi:hypothetical protein